MMIETSRLILREMNAGDYDGLLKRNLQRRPFLKSIPT